MRFRSAGELLAWFLRTVTRARVGRPCAATKQHEVRNMTSSNSRKGMAMTRRVLERCCLSLVTIVAMLPCLAATDGTRAAELRPIVRHPGYLHDRFDTQPKDIVREFRAYTSSFDGKDDDNGDARVDLWAIPEWVAYELRRTPMDLGRAPDKRPSPWITDYALREEGIAPSDNSYKGSGYSRGHLCMKSHAWRLGADADWNTHTVLNACPQLQAMNNGVWKGLENKTANWADKYGTVWIICGPVIYNMVPSNWIGDPGEVPVSVPDAFFKIVIKDSTAGGVPDVLAFILPMEGVGNYSSSNHVLTPYLTSVDVVEALTQLNFLTNLPKAIEEQIEKVVHTEIWAE